MSNSVFLSVLTAWLVLAIANVPVQYLALRRSSTHKNVVAIALSSLVFWPFQLAAILVRPKVSEPGAEAAADRPDKPSPLPATVRGTVSYCHHHGTERGHDSVWLKEYGDLAFVTDSATFDRIGIAEGRKLLLVVDEHADLAELGAEDALWITEGRLDDA